MALLAAGYSLSDAQWELISKIIFDDATGDITTEGDVNCVDVTATGQIQVGASTIIKTDRIKMYTNTGTPGTPLGGDIWYQEGLSVGVLSFYDGKASLSKQVLDDSCIFAGDVTGTVGATVVAKIHGDIVDTDAPTIGDVFQWNGSEWHQQPISKVRAHLSTDFAVSPSTWDKVQFDTEDYDTLSEYDPSTNFRFTCNEAGYYKVDAAVKWEFSASGNQILIAIRRNGSIVAGCERYVRYGVYHSQQVNDMIYLTASQYLEIFVYTTANGSLIASEGSSHFTVHRVL